MLNVKDADRVLSEEFETNTVISHAQSKIAVALKTLDITDACGGVASQGMEDLHRLLTIDFSQIAFGFISPVESEFHQLEAKLTENVFVRSTRSLFLAGGFDGRTLFVGFGLIILGSCQ